MASYSWAAPANGLWSSAANWNPALVPNDATADVTIDSLATAAYGVAIGAGENYTVRTLALNAANNLAGTNRSPYTAAILSIDGTLTFAPGSAGALSGSLQSYISLNGGTIVNPGTIDGFIQGSGNVLLTGTNGFYVTNWLQALAGVVTIDVKSIAEITGNTLFDGIYEAQGTNGFINLGGPRQDLIVNIATIVGPPLIPGGWTELILNGTNNNIGQWNGSTYVGIESTLTEIGNRATLDVIGGRDYNTANILTIMSGGLLNLQAGVVTTGQININGGTVQGSGTINSGVVNNGTLRALNGLLSIGSGGGLIGTGTVAFDFDQKSGTLSPTGSILQVNGVGPGQTFIMNGNDQLVINTPVSFAGTIQAKPGDEILLGGITANGATLQGQTLLVQNNGLTVASLNLGGSYAGQYFNIAPFGGASTELKISGPNFAVLNTTTGASSITPGTIYTGPVPGLDYEYANLTAESLNVTATTPNVFIHSGDGQDALNVSASNGTNILDGGGGSNFLTGGTGKDIFLVDVRNPASSIFSTIAGFSTGDDATIFGVTLADFTVSLSDNVGAPGFTGLAFAFSKPGQPIANLVLSGYTTADLANGRLTQSYGTTGDLPGLPGSPYLTIRAN